jgi:hypothetical protein
MATDLANDGVVVLSAWASQDSVKRTLSGTVGEREHGYSARMWNRGWAVHLSGPRVRTSVRKAVLEGVGYVLGGVNDSPTKCRCGSRQRALRMKHYQRTRKNDDHSLILTSGIDPRCST